MRTVISAGVLYAAIGVWLCAGCSGGAEGRASAPPLTAASSPNPGGAAGAGGSTSIGSAAPNAVTGSAAQATPVATGPAGAANAALAGSVARSTPGANVGTGGAVAGGVTSVAGTRALAADGGRSGAVSAAINGGSGAAGSAAPGVAGSAAANSGSDGSDVADDPTAPSSGTRDVNGPCRDLQLFCFDPFDMFILNPECFTCNSGMGCQDCEAFQAI